MPLSIRQEERDSVMVPVAVGLAASGPDGQPRHASRHAAPRCNFTKHRTVSLPASYLHQRLTRHDSEQTETVGRKQTRSTYISIGCLCTALGRTRAQVPWGSVGGKQELHLVIVPEPIPCRDKRERFCITYV
jgi:hypothetical protein